MLSKEDKKKKKKLYLQKISARESASLYGTGGSDTKMIDNHVVIQIVCKCGYEGTVTYGQMDYKILGKDSKGYIYFLCPSCERHLKYDPINGRIRIRKGVRFFRHFQLG